MDRRATTGRRRTPMLQPLELNHCSIGPTRPATTPLEPAPPPRPAHLRGDRGSVVVCEYCAKPFCSLWTLDASTVPHIIASKIELTALTIDSPQQFYLAHDVAWHSIAHAASMVLVASRSIARAIFTSSRNVSHTDTSPNASPQA